MALNSLLNEKGITRSSYMTLIKAPAPALVHLNSTQFKLLTNQNTEYIKFNHRRTDEKHIML
ncbi:hypothetical protein HanXRQr2_Chr17g0819151 [Helianthus annuus]|uniref:Uncharacterized protein n=1 Tax=Helianthus annuus TaxID=4232 RepID=A0A9K3GVB5_HELAN|nr:hypothetical protein HanXRQr2_Chr17g0819151 [Helianthus annuus]